MVSKTINPGSNPGTRAMSNKIAKGDLVMITGASFDKNFDDKDILKLKESSIGSIFVVDQVFEFSLSSSDPYKYMITLNKEDEDYAYFRENELQLVFTI